MKKILNENDLNILSAMGKSKLILAIKDLSNRLTAMSIIANARLEAIQILGFIANKEIKEVDFSNPIIKSEENKKLILEEFKNLSLHFRNRADYFDNLRKKIEKQKVPPSPPQPPPKRIINEDIKINRNKEKEVGND